MGRAIGGLEMPWVVASLFVLSSMASLCAAAGSGVYALGDGVGRALSLVWWYRRSARAISGHWWRGPRYLLSDGGTLHG